MQCSAVQCSAVQLHCTLQWSALQCSAVYCSAAQRITVSDIRECSGRNSVHCPAGEWAVFFRHFTGWKTVYITWRFLSVIIIIFHSLWIIFFIPVNIVCFFYLNFYIVITKNLVYGRQRISWPIYYGWSSLKSSSTYLKYYFLKNILFLSNCENFV